jgi:hypothetical protein
MAVDKTMVILSIIATTCSVASLVLTASIALKCNGKLTRKIEEFLGMQISE